MDLPHWLDFILIGVAVTIVAELLRPNFAERMKDKAGKIYLIQQLIISILLALILSVFTDSVLICAVCMIASKGDAILNSFAFRALLLKHLITKDESGEDVLPLDSKTLGSLPVAEQILKELGIPVHETRIQQELDSREALIASKGVASEITLPEEIKRELDKETSK